MNEDEPDISLGVILGAMLVVVVTLLGIAYAYGQFAIFQVSSSARPTADVVCNFATGVFTGLGGGTCIASPTTCNGVADDAPAFRAFKTWALTVDPTKLIELDTPVGTCLFISGNVNSNNTSGIKRLQIVGYGTTFSDNGGAGGGFALGATGVRFDNTHSARFATISAGATSVTLLNTALCSLFSAGDWTLLAGIDIQGFGDPPNPQIYEYIQINSVASCGGSGVITLLTPTVYGYKSTWPLYNPGSALNSDLGGPATIYALDQAWVTNQAFYGLTIDQTFDQTNANGQYIAFYDLIVPMGQIHCPIPSQNISWTIRNGSMVSCTIEVDKIVQSVTFTNVTLRRLLFQSGADPQHFTCNNCTISPIGMSGTAGITTFSGGTIADFQIGAVAYGAAGGFSAVNTVISGLQFTGASQDTIATRGTWASGTLTVPPNMSISAAIQSPASPPQIRLTVSSTAGWSTNHVGDGPSGGACVGSFPVTVIDGTHVDLQGSTFTATCTGTFGSLPLRWAVPGANVYLADGQTPLGLMFQVADLAVGANNATVVSFNQSGSPYAGGFPTVPGSNWSIIVHGAPSWSCTGCTGAINVTDITGVPTGPFGSYATRVLTSANNDMMPAMPIFGLLTEADFTVTAACSGASNVALEQSSFYQTIGSATLGIWNPTINGLTASGTPRKIFPTSSSGAQSGDNLVTPGANTWLVMGQTIPLYSTVANCGTASTTVTIQTNQGVVYP